MPVTSPPAGAGPFIVGPATTSTDTSKLSAAPNLAGRPESWLIKTLNDLRAGVRRNETMSKCGKSLTAADVADLAACCSAVAISAKPPR